MIEEGTYSRIMNFFVHTQLLIAAGSLGVMLASSKLLNVPFSAEMAFMVFSSCFAIYNINRRTDAEEDKLNTPYRAEYIKKYELVLYISVVMYLAAITLSVFVNLDITAVLLFNIIIGIVYSYGVLPNFVKKATGYERLKQVPLVKNFVVSLVWAFIPLMVSLNARIELNITVFFVLSYVFLRLFIGCVAFDVRDIYGDKVSGIDTLPSIIGIKRTINMLHVLNTISGIALFLLVYYNHLPPVGHIINLITLYGYYYIHKLGGSRKSLINLCDRVIDAEYIAIGVLAFVGDKLLHYWML